MIVKINPFKPKGKISPPSSKSIAHRILICSALSKGQTKIKNIGASADVLATIDCLKKLGLNVVLANDCAIVNGITNPPKEAILDCGESGSTLRFLMPICSALGVKATFTGRGKLLSRPNDKLIEVLKTHGVEIDNNTHSGTLSGGKFKIDASISSQYISGLLFASVITGEDCEIELQNDVVSKSYILMTLDTLRTFGIKFEFVNNTIKIFGGQNFLSPKEILVEGDWSGAGFPLVLGATAGKIKIENLNINSSQGDKVIIDVLKTAGVKIKIKKNKITVKKSRLSAIDFDINDCPDTAPILAVLCAKASGISVLRNTERLKIKESNRLEAIIENLGRAGITAYESENSLIIEGGITNGNKFDGYNDHRIVMAFSVLAISSCGSSIVTDKEAVSKSYPQFFEDIKNLGGESFVDL